MKIKKNIIKKLNKKNIIILSIGLVFLISGLVFFNVFNSKTFKSNANENGKFAFNFKTGISINPEYLEINRELNNPNKDSSINNIAVEIENLGNNEQCVNENKITDYTIKVTNAAHGSKEETMGSTKISKNLDCNIMYFDLDIDSLYFADEDVPYYLSVDMTISGKRYTSNTVKISFDENDSPIVSNPVNLSIENNKIIAQSDIEDIITIYSIENDVPTEIGKTDSKATRLEINTSDLRQGALKVYAETSSGKSDTIFFQNFKTPIVRIDPGFEEDHNYYQFNLGDNLIIPIQIEGGRISSPMYAFDTNAVKNYIYLEDNTTGQEFSIKGLDKNTNNESYTLTLNPFYKTGEFTLVVKKGFAVNDNNVESNEARVRVQITDIEIALNGKPKGQIFLGSSENGEEFATIYNGAVSIYKIGPNAGLYKKNDDNQWESLGTANIGDRITEDGWYKIEIVDGNGEITEEKYFVISNTSPKINVKDNEYNSINTYTDEEIQIPIVIENGQLSKDINDIALGSDIFTTQNTTNDRIVFKSFEKIADSENEYLLTISGIKKPGDFIINMPEGFAVNNYSEKSDHTTIDVDVYKPEIVNLESDKYYIKNIYSGTTIDKFKEEVGKLDNNLDLSTIEVTEAKNNPNKVGTGSTFSINNETYTAIITGDVTGDGEITIHDIRGTIYRTYGPDEVKNKKDEYYYASDLNEDNNITIHDIRAEIYNVYK